MRSSVLIILIFLSVGFGYSQTPQKLIHLGDIAMTNGNYASAINFYTHVLDSAATRSNNTQNILFPYEVNTSYNPTIKKESKKPIVSSPPQPIKGSRAIVIHKLAAAYRKVKDYKNAQKWYAKAVQNPSKEFPHTSYYYGCSLISNEKYSQAKEVFQKIKEKRKEEKGEYYLLAEKRIKDCDFAIANSTDNHFIYTIEELGPIINRGTSSFGMMYYKGGLLFASARIDKTVPSEYEGGKNPYNSDIYITQKDTNENFTTPKWFKGNVNSKATEGGAAFSPDGEAIYFTRVDSKNKKAIYVTRFFHGHWTPPFKLEGNINLEGFNSMTPCVGDYLRGKDSPYKLYFSSNRPGGKGGADLWVTTITKGGVTTPPKNIGGNVNTTLDEVTPFYNSSSQTLYFSSNGHTGFGGLDIFSSVYNPLYKKWSPPANLGRPINSSKDDAYYILKEVGEPAFLTSDRKACEKCKGEASKILNIYCNKIYEVFGPHISAIIQGHVYDSKSKQPLSNALIEVKDINGINETISFTTDENGFYKQQIKLNKKYFIKSSKNGYFADADIQNTLGLRETTSLLQNFYLRKIPKTEIKIPGIKYDLNSSFLREESKAVLDSLVGFLKLNSNLKVEIRAHTDFQGEDKYNKWLSQRRAQRVVDYLIEKGISREKLISEGYGESKPVTIKVGEKEVRLTPDYIQSITNQDLRDKYNQLNRRTAFKVIGQSENK